MEDFEKKQCPECKAMINVNDTVCSQCGFPFEDSQMEEMTGYVDKGTESDEMGVPHKRKKKWIILLITGIVLLSCLVLFFLLVFPIVESKVSFKKAQKFEESMDYTTAIHWYNKVNERDENNYKIATEKKESLNDAMINNKFAAKAILSLIDRNFISSVDDVSSMGVGATSSSKGKFTCKIDGYGYTVSDSNDRDSGNYAKYYTSALTGFSITEYKASYEWNGWLTSTYNEIRQNTSEVLFDGDELFTKKENINEDLLKKYLELYEKEKDLTVLD